MVGMPQILVDNFLSNARVSLWARKRTQTTPWGEVQSFISKLQSRQGQKWNLHTPVSSFIQYFLVGDWRMILLWELLEKHPKERCDRIFRFQPVRSHHNEWSQMVRTIPKMTNSQRRSKSTTWRCKRQWWIMCVSVLQWQPTWNTLTSLWQEQGGETSHMRGRSPLD